MRIRTVLLVFLLGSALAADNLEKTQKKQLEAQVKIMTKEAEKLEKAGQLAEARTKYAESQALIEMNQVTDAIKHLDEEIHKRVKDSLNQSRKLYESRKFKEAAAALDDAMKFQASQPVLAYDLALSHYQLGDRNKALEYVGKAKAGTPDPKQKQNLLQLATFFTTGENGLSVKDSDKNRIIKVNRLTESVGVEASLADAGGDEDSTFEIDAESDGATTSDPLTPRPASATTPKPSCARQLPQQCQCRLPCEFVQRAGRSQARVSEQSFWNFRSGELCRIQRTGGRSGPVAGKISPDGARRPR